MNDFTLIKPESNEKNKSQRLDNILEKNLKNYKFDVITDSEQFEKANLHGKKLVFAISLGESGINFEYYKVLEKIRLNKDCMEGCSGVLIVDGLSEFHTKDVARNLALSANVAGCTFIGKSLAEATGTLKNYSIIAKNLNVDNLKAYETTVGNLLKNLVDFEKPRKKDPKVLVIHAGDSEKSNTRMLWEIVKLNMENVTIDEISLFDGDIKDCKGCPYVACLHFGERKSCFYGGVITEKVYPAILDCDALVAISPNYNDSPTAYIVAFINRLTALLRVNKLSDKQLFAIIVSGYSGGDIVAKQLLGALNMNKPFILPSRFALFETANNPSEIKEISGIEKVAKEFAENILSQIKK